MTISVRIDFIIERYLKFQLKRASVLYDEMFIREFRLNAEAKNLFYQLTISYLQETIVFLKVTLEDLNLPTPVNVDYKNLIRQLDIFRSLIHDILEKAPDNCEISSEFPLESKNVKISLDYLYSHASQLLKDLKHAH